ncbi:MAG TPA: hypothetical protein PK990_10455, partial [Salinivirgaceae bacterium]|nr:hypothetical protein [Salinivirgaceae bacterium]
HRNESRNPMLTLSFAGTLNPWHPLELFLQEVNRFCSHEKIPVRLQFFGVNQPERVVAFQSQAVNHLHIEIYPKMPNSELIKVLSGSDGLILFNDYYYIGTKIFDYLALQKRILFCFSDDKEALGLKERFYHLSQLDGYDQIPQIELIRQTESGVVVRDREHLYETLKEWGREFSATGQLTCRSSGYEFYSRKNQTKRLAEVIHQHISPKL